MGPVQAMKGPPAGADSYPLNHIHREMEPDMHNSTRSPSELAAASTLDQPSARKLRGLSRTLGMVGLVLALAACGSDVKLDEVPVDTKTGAMVEPGQQGAGAGAAGTGVGSNGASGVEMPGAENQQPEKMARIVYFDFDSFVIKPEFAGVLESHAKYLNAHQSRRVALEGHTDERGGREYNLALGQKRSEAVRRALALLGVKENQMEAVSFGEEKPAVQGFDEAAFAENRRVEISYR
jgi:peptidoglycan-associated lipoprotein